MPTAMEWFIVQQQLEKQRKMDELSRKKNDLYNAYADLLLEAEKEYDFHGKSEKYFLLKHLADQKFEEYKKL